MVPDPSPLPSSGSVPGGIDVVIRFRDSAATLPAVLASLAAQTGAGWRLRGIDTGSRDGSADLIRAAGGEVVEWRESYSHPRVLNFAVQHCTAPYVLALSSHTTLEDPQTLARMEAALNDPQVACVSGKWDRDPFYSDRIDWPELQRKGIKFGSIYSNSMGMFRRDRWLEVPFDESLEGSEDYAWAVEQLKRGSVCIRLDFPFGYQRATNDRNYELSSAAFGIARRAGLPVAWLGPKGTVLKLATLGLRSLTARGEDAAGVAEARREHADKLRAWFDNRRA